ncbi:MAG: peptidoglycan editing factor PgeF [Deltaproteobacteria bacterium]
MSDIALRAERLAAAGFTHAFSTRRGGVSEGQYASLNLGRSVGDEPAHVLENATRFAEAAGLDPARLYEVSQVHGASVITVHGDEDAVAVRARQADALVSRGAGFAVGVRTADCAPVLLGDRVTGHAAAVHAGWRGVVANVVGEAVRALGKEPKNVIAAIGPSIGPCCFEVGDEVAISLASAAGDGIVLRKGPSNPHVDLWRAIEHQLRAAGVGVVDTLGRCTVCESELFFSYRRDGQRSGRMLSAVAARAPLG